MLILSLLLSLILCVSLIPAKLWRSKPVSEETFVLSRTAVKRSSRAGAEWEMGEHGEHGEHQEGTSRSKFTLPLLRWGSCRHVADTTRHVVLPSGDHVVLMLSPMSICSLFWLVWLVSMMPFQSFSIPLVPFPILLMPFLPTLFVLFVRSELSCYNQKRSKVQSFRAIPTSMSCVFSSLQWDHTCFLHCFHSLFRRSSWWTGSLQRPQRPQRPQLCQWLPRLSLPNYMRIISWHIITI